MPTVSNFYGIKIRMYTDEHGIVHFHAKSAEHTVVVAVGSLEIIVGELPTNKQKLVDAWAVIHHKELIENANRIERGEKPFKIPGLK